MPNHHQAAKPTFAEFQRTGRRSFCTIADAADFLGVHQLTIRREIERGNLTRYNVARRVRLDVAEVEALARHTGSAT